MPKNFMSDVGESDWAEEQNMKKEIELSQDLARELHLLQTEAKQLQAEAALAFVPNQFAAEEEAWTALGFEARRLDQIQVNVWREAAQENNVANTQLLFKQLRIDRVLRPL